MDYRGNNHDVESVFCAELGQQLYVARLLMPEAKILADQNGLYMQITDKNLLDKFTGICQMFAVIIEA